ncbi:MAG TPA: 6,7-dimethyl-8-ribityllumazine synthase [Candidatus Eisenbacteria bacterium]|jgi:6,7-dimethyl-8-ribityllumazine synthase|nr:6,7-dimethyl-8-ribityllumazine synthase [Candidatus Eisenbacteria bacterium]
MRKAAPGPLSRVRRTRGSFDAKGKKFAIVMSRFNEPLTRRLLEGAVDTFVRHGAREKDIHVVEVPGAFEIPLAASKLIARSRPDALLTLSVVIKGETRHFDQVVAETARGLRELGERTGVPVILGMIPATNVLQAIERTGIKQMNKGREWALSAIEMAGVAAELDGKPARRKKN